MTGLIRRYIYFYADEDLRNLINVENPYYPFTEGTALSLAKLSALAHEHLYINTRMLIKLMDRILLYLANKTIKEAGMELEDYWWYREIRKYGGVKHSGFGLGFERLIMYMTGMENIRDVIPFPRTPRNAEF